MTCNRDGCPDPSDHRHLPLQAEQIVADVLVAESQRIHFARWKKERAELGVTCRCPGPPLYACPHWPLNTEETPTPGVNHPPENPDGKRETEQKQDPRPPES